MGSSSEISGQDLDAAFPGRSLSVPGDNPQGQVGDGTNDHRFSPVPVGGGLRFQSIEAGFRNTCGLALSGPRPSPILVPGGQSFIRLALGGAFTCGLTSGRVVYCWGDNGLRTNVK